MTAAPRSERILLVEDEPVLLRVLQATLAHEGFPSGAATSGAAAEAAIAAGGWDAVLLDLGLPDCDGRELLARLRASSDLPIIVVSGRASERDKIEALDLGADDYVGKPFLPGELLARVRAALRRSRGRAAAPVGPADRMPLRAGALTLDPFDHSAELGGERVRLNPSEYRVFACLAARPGETVSRGELLAALHGASEPSTDSKLVDVYVSRIRAKLRALPGGEDLIVSVRGAGWRLRAP